MSDPRILDPAGRGATQLRNVTQSVPAFGLVTVSANNYTIRDTDATVQCSTMYGPVTITLPRAKLFPGRTITVRKADAGQEAVKIRSTNGEPISGQTWVSLAAAGEFTQLQSDGTAWQVVLHL